MSKESPVECSEQSGGIAVQGSEEPGKHDSPHTIKRIMPVGLLGYPGKVITVPQGSFKPIPYEKSLLNGDGLSVEKLLVLSE